MTGGRGTPVALPVRRAEVRGAVRRCQRRGEGECDGCCGDEYEDGQSSDPTYRAHWAMRTHEALHAAKRARPGGAQGTCWYRVLRQCDQRASQAGTAAGACGGIVGEHL